MSSPRLLSRFLLGCRSRLRCLLSGAPAGHWRRLRARRSLHLSPYVWRRPHYLQPCRSRRAELPAVATGAPGAFRPARARRPPALGGNIAPALGSGDRLEPARDRQAPGGLDLAGRRSLTHAGPGSGDGHPRVATETGAFALCPRHHSLGRRATEDRPDFEAERMAARTGPRPRPTPDAAQSKPNSGRSECPARLSDPAGRETGGANRLHLGVATPINPRLWLLLGARSAPIQFAAGSRIEAGAHFLAYRVDTPAVLGASHAALVGRSCGPSL